MIKNNLDITYYHGTFFKSAVEGLLTGQPLRPMRPKGRSSHPRSEKEAVYLTPSFNQAVEYAYMRDRTDWPDFSLIEAVSPHVFAFKTHGVTVRPEEDELGYAVKVALHTRLNQKTHWNLNSEFAQKLQDSHDVQSELIDLALRSNLQKSWVDTPATIRGADRAKIGLRLMSQLPQSLEIKIIELGISVATTEKLAPITSYKINPGPRTIENMTEITLMLPENEYSGYPFNL